MDTNRSHAHGPAFSLFELLVILAILAILAGLLLPALAKAKQKAQRVACVNNLKQVGLSFRVWEGDYGDRYPAMVPKSKGGVKEDAADAFRSFQVMSNELNNPKILVCPSDPARQAAPNFIRFSNQNVSYFVGVDADETWPAMPLSGDRNVTINGMPADTGLVTVKTSDSLGWTVALHQNAGNLGLADGSVQQCSSAGLQQYFARSGTNVNRLAIP